MKTHTADELQAILRAHVAWLRNEIGGTRADLTRADLAGADLTGADLTRADLAGADLTGAVLRGAVLRGAVLRGADLVDAVLRGADLTDAVLTGAVLRGAVLRGADLTRAVLTDAVLRDANLTGADQVDSMIMPGGYTFAAYNTDVVPALLAAGGRDPREVAAKSWNCHQWTNCPMAEAFGVHDPNDVPPLYREHARLFVQLFDANLIPNPYAISSEQGGAE